MSNSYTTLWTNELCRRLKRSGYAGQWLAMLFGGPHHSLPSFQRAGVEPGDRIYRLAPGSAAELRQLILDAGDAETTRAGG